MCEAKGSERYPEGRRCPGTTRLVRALTYTEIKLDQAVQGFSATAASQNVVSEDAEKPGELSPSWLKKLLAAAMAVHRKLTTLQEKRALVRAEREQEEAERIAKIEEEAERKAAETKERRIKAAYKKLDQASDAQTEAALDLELLKDPQHPGGVERRKILLKEAEKEARSAQTAISRIELKIGTDGEYTDSQLKRLETLHRTLEAASALVEHLEGAQERCPDLRTAQLRYAQARSHWDDCEKEVIAAEEP